MRKIIIIRHGNTFESNEVPRRVGHTDIPLTSYGCEQIHALCDYLKVENLIPDLVLCAPLLRTKKSAQIITDTFNLPTANLNIDLKEMHYGPDENQTDEYIKSRIGPELDMWNTKDVIPDSWPETQERMLDRWHRLMALTDTTLKGYNCIAFVTSQGIARFAPHILPTSSSLSLDSYRLRTAHCSVVSQVQQKWEITKWNQA